MKNLKKNLFFQKNISSYFLSLLSVCDRVYKVKFPAFAMTTSDLRAKTLAMLRLSARYQLVSKKKYIVILLYKNLFQCLAHTR